MHKRLVRFLSLGFFFVPQIASAQTTIFVDAAVTGPGSDGSSWCAAYTTLHEALDNVVAGDTIKVANGIYVPDPSVGREATFLLVSGVAIEGGYAGCGEPDPDARDVVTYETILSGDLNRDDVFCPSTPPSNCCEVHLGTLPFCDDSDCLISVQAVEQFCNTVEGLPGWHQGCVDAAYERCGCLCAAQDNSENAYHVVTADGTSISTTLDGVTITGGNSDEFYAPHGPDGPGLTIANDGSLTLVNCTMRDNNAFALEFAIPYGRGGGVFSEGAGALSLTGCTFSGNTVAENGGGLFVEDGTVTLSGCTFNGNNAEQGGGGAFFDGGALTADNCEFTANTGSYSGGGMHVTDAAPTLTGCLFQDNSLTDVSDTRGGGLYCTNNDTLADPLRLTGCTFTGNTAHSGAGMALDESGIAEVINCQFGDEAVPNSANTAEHEGGGIHVDYSSELTVFSSTFDGNIAGDGGGIGVGRYSTVTVDDCDFTNNTATSSGGGLYVGPTSFSTITIQNNCTFDSNVTGPVGRGGGIHSADSDTTILSAVFTNNEAYSGGGIYADRFGGTVILNGCNVNNNYASNSGGGIYAHASVPMLIDSCTIEQNGEKGPDVTPIGGGIYMGGAGLTLQQILNSTIRLNKAGDGGGIAIPYGPVLIFGTTIAENVADFKGGAISTGGLGTAWISHCKLVSNTSHGDGGAVYVWSDGKNPVSGLCPPGPSMTFLNTLIANNIADGTEITGGDGGGVLQFGGYLEFINCTIADNIVTRDGGGLLGGECLYTIIDNTIFWGNYAPIGNGPQITAHGIAVVLYSDIQDGSDDIDTGTGGEVFWQSSIEADPLFIDANGPDNNPATWLDNDYHLDATLPDTSPCIDTGSNTYVDDGVLDLDGSPRVSNCLVDMGVYEVYNPLAAPTADPLGIKNRYISFAPPSSPNNQMAFRVTLTQSTDFPNAVDPIETDDRFWWVGAPEVVSLNGAVVDPIPGFSNFDAATLHCNDPNDPNNPGLFRDWEGVDMLHLYHQGIVPDAVYEVQAIRSGCNLLREDSYSAPLTISTAIWGDTIGDCSTNPCSPPNGAVDIVDIQAVLNAYSSLAGAIIKPRADLEPATADRLINITDAVAAINGLNGLTFPDSIPGYTYPTEVCLPPEDCVADMLVDSNNDGVVDGSDEAEEDLQPMIFTYNVDDDDFSGTADIFEAPVVGEDDLAEVRLMALEECDPADPKAATWALNWTSDLITVWQNADKSDNQGDMIENGVERPWPPPSSVWLEAADVVGDFTMTFWIFPFVGSTSDPDTVNIKVECPAPSLAAGPGECYANIRTDSNNDGKIDECDEVVEAASPGVIVYINDDDDNENGTLDFDESPVVGENDLAEVQLTTSCVPNDPNLAWWSISWLASTPEVLQVWLQPDKSDGAGGASTPLVSGTQNAWPPPNNIWLESLDEFSDSDLTFTVFDGNAAFAASSLGPQPSNVVKTSAQPAHTVWLRVVMFVEEGADLDSPPNPTAGCNFTQTQVRDLVNEARQLAAQAHKGLRLEWYTPPPLTPSEFIYKLESPCLETRSFSIPACIDDLMTFNNDWRQTRFWSFSAWVAGHAGGGNAALVTPDAYIPDACVANIYFVGNVVGPGQEIFFGATMKPSSTKPLIIINDNAQLLHSLSAASLAIRFDTTQRRRTVGHEILCHFVSDLGPHTPVSPNLNVCSLDVCISGFDLNSNPGCYACGAKVNDNGPEHGLQVPSCMRGFKFSALHKNGISNYLQGNCP